MRFTEDDVRSLLQVREEFPRLQPMDLFFVLRLARRLHRYCETMCGRDLRPREEAAVCAIKARVEGVLTGAGVPEECIRFNADPRGYPLRLRLPSGRYNTWDGETWGIG